MSNEGKIICFNRVVDARFWTVHVSNKQHVDCLKIFTGQNFKLPSKSFSALWTKFVFLLFADLPISFRNYLSACDAYTWEICPNDMPEAALANVLTKLYLAALYVIDSISSLFLVCSVGLLLFSILVIKNSGCDAFCWIEESKTASNYIPSLLACF